MIQDEVPLIWTLRGTLPVADLQCAVRWEESDEYTKMIETYTLDGEVVRESVHVLLKRGLNAEAMAQPM